MSDPYNDMTGAMDQFAAASRDVIATLADIRNHASRQHFSEEASEQIAIEAWKHLLEMNR